MDLNEFDQQLRNARISDSHYPVSGLTVLFPSGLCLWKKIVDFFRTELTRLGYQQYYFPYLVSAQELQKIGQLQDFKNYILWLKDENMFLRPTGECAIYPMFKQWIRSSADLPLKVVQDLTFFRKSKKLYPLLGKKEYLMLEGHSAHATESDSQNELLALSESLETLYQKLALPTIKVHRPLWGNNKKINKEIISFDCLVPDIKKTINIGVAYNQSNIISRLFDIKYRDKKGFHFVHHTTLGVSQSIMGAYLLVHQDDKGFVFLPGLCLFDVVIIPIFTKTNKKKVIDYAEKIKGQIKETVHIDYSDKSIGEKFYEWDKKGVPIRIEIGEKEMQEDFVTLYNRAFRTKYFVSLDQLTIEIKKNLALVQQELQKRSNRIISENIKTVATLAEFEKANKEGFVTSFYCCSEENSCAQELEKKSIGEILGSNISNKGHPCIYCKKIVTSKCFFSRRL